MERWQRWRWTGRTHLSPFCLRDREVSEGWECVASLVLPLILQTNSFPSLEPSPDHLRPKGPNHHLISNTRTLPTILPAVCPSCPSSSFMFHRLPSFLRFLPTRRPRARLFFPHPERRSAALRKSKKMADRELYQRKGVGGGEREDWLDPGQPSRVRRALDLPPAAPKTTGGLN